MITLRKFFSATLNTGFEKKKKKTLTSPYCFGVFLFVSYGRVPALSILKGLAAAKIYWFRFNGTIIVCFLGSADHEFLQLLSFRNSIE